MLDMPGSLAAVCGVTAGLGKHSLLCLYIDGKWRTALLSLAGVAVELFTAVQMPGHRYDVAYEPGCGTGVRAELWARWWWTEWHYKLSICAQLGRGEAGHHVLE